MLSRRGFLGLVGGGAATLVVTQDLLALAAKAGGTTITVYRSPSCSCCGEWMKHLEKNGFTVEEKAMEDVDPMKKERNIPEKLWSCHTATSGAYVFEGHVPADLIQKVLTEKPAFAGLAVAGMPMGSPGMEHGDHKEPYDVMSFTCCGEIKAYAKR